MRRRDCATTVVWCGGTLALVTLVTLSASIAVHLHLRGSHAWLNRTVAPEPAAVPREEEANSELEALKAIRDRFFGCEGCKIGYPACNIPIAKALDYLPEESETVLPDPELMNTVFASYQSWLCSLPAAVNLTSSACTYARDMDNFFCSITPAKAFKQWALTIVRHAIGMTGIEGKLERYIFPERYMAYFRWRWQDKQCNNSREVSSWYIPDSCPSRIDTVPVPRDIRLAWEGYGALAFHKATAQSTMLFKGLTLRLLLEKHIGSCLRNRMDSLLDLETTLLPGPAVQLVNGTNVTVPRPCPRDSPIISMHVRRGDSCEVMMTERDLPDHGRPCYATALYLEHALRLRRKFNACRIRVATDSADFIREVGDFAHEHGFEVNYLDFDRSVFDPPVKGSRGFIENRHHSSAKTGHIVATAMAEIEFLAQGHLLLGSGASTITRVVHLLMAAYTGRVPPYISLDDPFFFYMRDKCALARW